MNRTFTAAVRPLLPPSATSLFFACNPDGLLVHEEEGRARLPDRETLAMLMLPLDTAHYLGRLGDEDCFAIHLPKETAQALSAPFHVRSLRRLYGNLPEELFALAGRAAQIALWDDTHRYCGRCATALERQPHERAKRCPTCELTAFPRLSPAVIVLVQRGAQALLARSSRFPMPMYSTLAGFVEPGETLEEAASREIQEEVGVAVKNLRYFGSQPWPFPHSLMVGFRAEYAGGELKVDADEIVDARFFDADDLPMIPPPLSIARHLINAWLAEQGK